MTQRLCAHPGCIALAQTRGRCRQHATEQRKANRSVNDRFYSSKAWRLSRARQLFEHPLCQYEENGNACGVIADSVHHILPIEEGGSRRDPTNLMSVCRPHHMAIHAKKRGSVDGTRKVADEASHGRLGAQAKHREVNTPT
jgi:5-methylcytosine-specific restriction endonuclease McrA